MATGTEMRTRARRLCSNVSAAYLTCVVTSICSLVAVPIYLHFLGKEEYGLWLAILSVLMPLSLMGMGFPTVSQNMLAEAKASDRADDMNRIITTSFAFLSFAAVAACLLALVGLNLGVIRHLLKTSPEIGGVIVPVLLIALAGFAFNQPLQVFRLALRAFERVDFEQYGVAVLSVVNILLMTLVLSSGRGIVGVSVVFALVQFGGGIVFFAVLTRKFPQMRLSPRYFSWTLLRDMASPGFGFFVLSVSGVLIWGIDNLVISGVMGVAFLASFATAARLTTSLQGLVAIPFGTSGPTITALRAEGNDNALRRLFVFSTKLALSASILFTVELACFGRSFIALWAGRSVLPDRSTFLVLVAILAANVLMQPSYALIIATTRHQRYMRFVVCEAAANLALSWWWAHKWGVLGVALGTLAPHVLFSGSYLIGVGVRMSGLTFSEAWGRHIAALAFPSVMTVAVGFFLRNFSASWLQWTISAGLTFLTFASACWIASINHEERGALAAALRMA